MTIEILSDGLFAIHDGDGIVVSADTAALEVVGSPIALRHDIRDTLDLRVEGVTAEGDVDYLLGASYLDFDVDVDEDLFESGLTGKAKGDFAEDGANPRFDTFLVALGDEEVVIVFEGVEAFADGGEGEVGDVDIAYGHLFVGSGLLIVSEEDEVGEAEVAGAVFVEAEADGGLLGVGGYAVHGDDEIVGEIEGLCRCTKEGADGAEKCE